MSSLRVDLITDSTSRTPKASCGCARSTPSWSGSRTSTSRGDPAPSKNITPRSLGLLVMAVGRRGGPVVSSIARRDTAGGVG
jgi:hypothetical protein